MARHIKKLPFLRKSPAVIHLASEAQAKFDEATENPDMSGYLKKQSFKTKKWSKKWFVLKDKYLFYSNEQGQLPEGIINLNKCIIKKSTIKDNVFQIMTKKSVTVHAHWTNRTFYLVADSDQDAQKWMTALYYAGNNDDITD